MPLTVFAFVYSPDLSPIEGAFSKLKAFLRRVGPRPRQDLYEALSQALGMPLLPRTLSAGFLTAAISLLNRRYHEHSIFLLSALYIIILFYETDRAIIAALFGTDL